MTTRWEYKWAYIVYGTEKIRGQRVNDWFLHRSDGTALVGLDEILASFGTAGWELVSVVGEDSTTVNTVHFTGQRLFFKRPAA